MNQSKKNDKRFWKKWFNSGSVQKKKIDIWIPFKVESISKNHLTDWNTVSCLAPGADEEEERYVYFVTQNDLALKVYSELPKDAIDYEQGRKFVWLE